MSIHMIQSRDLQWSFGDRLRKVRREAGLTQRQLASELQVTSAAIDAWESERNLPRNLQGMANRVELIFGLPRGWMLGYADPERPRDPSGPGNTVRLRRGLSIPRVRSSLAAAA